MRLSFLPDGRPHALHSHSPRTSLSENELDLEGPGWVAKAFNDGRLTLKNKKLHLDDSPLQLQTPKSYTRAELLEAVDKSGLAAPLKFMLRGLVDLLIEADMVDL